MTTRLFVDTSAWVALANRAEAAHGAVSALLQAPGVRLVTSSFVFDETVTLCRMRLGHPVALRVGAVLRGDAVDLVHVTPEDLAEAWVLFAARADQAYSFTDCTSFVLMRRLRLDTAAALDADFAREGFRVVPGG
jgi:predicted nucleic acid-binding protein